MESKGKRRECFAYWILTKFKIFVPFVGKSPGGCEYMCVCGKQWKVVSPSVIRQRNPRERNPVSLVYGLG